MVRGGEGLWGQNPVWVVVGEGEGERVGEVVVVVLLLCGRMGEGGRGGEGGGMGGE